MLSPEVDMSVLRLSMVEPVPVVEPVEPEVVPIELDPEVVPSPAVLAPGVVPVLPVIPALPVLLASGAVVPVPGEPAVCACATPIMATIEAMAANVRLFGILLMEFSCCRVKGRFR
jgi:hypothetical protein